jgi:hypothetical protein
MDPMADLETGIQTAETKIARLQSILDNTQQGLQKAEAVVHTAKRIQPVVMVLLAATVAVSAALLATWLTRRFRRWRNPS